MTYVVIATGQSNGKGTASVLTEYLPNGYEVINCAVGGTSVFEWQKGGDLYRDTVIAALAARNSGKIIRGLFSKTNYL